MLQNLSSYSKLLTGTVTLTLGSGFGRLIAAITLPLLTRIYTPLEFGLFAAINAIILILFPLFNFRYSLAIPLPKKDSTGFNLLILSILINTANTLLFSLLFLGFAHLFTLDPDLGQIVTWWPIILLGVWGAATYDAFSFWCTRKRNYKIIATTTLVQNIFGTSIKLLCGLIGITTSGLIIGQVGSYISGILMILRISILEFSIYWSRVNLKNLIKAGHLYRHFPIWRLPSSVLMTLSMHSPILFTSFLYGKELSGQLSLAILLLSLPSAIIGQSAGKVLYGESALAAKDNILQIRKKIIKVQKVLFMLAIFPAVILFFYGEVVFETLFGDGWAQAGYFAAILSFSAVFQFTSTPLIQVINLLADQQFFLLINILRFVVTIIIFTCAIILSLSASYTILLYSIFSTLFYITISFFIFKNINQKKIL